MTDDIAQVRFFVPFEFLEDWEAYDTATIDEAVAEYLIGQGAPLRMQLIARGSNTNGLKSVGVTVPGWKIIRHEKNRTERMIEVFFAPVED